MPLILGGLKGVLPINGALYALDFHPTFVKCIHLRALTGIEARLKSLAIRVVDTSYSLYLRVTCLRMHLYIHITKRKVR